MTRIVDSTAFTNNRDFTKFHKRDPLAEKVYGALSAVERTRFRFGSIKVGKVDFGEWPKDDPRYGTPRRLPLYLFRHDDHMSIDYPHGFPGHNERVTCHCGYNHYFASSRYRELRAIGQLIVYLIRNGRPRTSRRT